MKTLLLCIDFINDVIHPDGKIAACAKYIAEHHVIEHVNQAIKFAREKNILIAQVKVGFSEDYRECPKQSPLFSKVAQLGALQLDTWGCEFYQDLNVEPEDYIVIKHRVSALYATDLETILRSNDIQHVLICGVSTNMAVETVARELHDRDYYVTILKDACGAASEQIQQASLLTLSRIAQVISVDDAKSLL